jgi:hypothetical protein
MTADQEQAERGASTVSNRGYWISQASLDDIAEREVQLRTDLERVTAELAEAQALLDGQSDRIDALIEETRRWQRLFVFATNGAKHVEAERDAMREVCEAAGMIAIREEYRTHRVLRAALVRLDARRKATADAEEEGK